MAKKSAGRKEVVLQIPDLGLSKAQIASVKKAFKNQLVSTMAEKSGARAAVVAVRVRIIVVMAEQ
jgi:hypothetical protein